MPKQIVSDQKRGFANWTTRDLLVTAVISIVIAIPLIGANYILVMFIMPLGMLAICAVQGIWIIPPILIAYILRRPGAVFLSQLIRATIMIPFSTTWWTVSLFALVYAISAELVFLTVRYRNYSSSFLMFAGIVVGLACTAVMWLPMGVGLLSIEMQIAILVISIISGALAGWLAKMLADSIAKTGVLNSYAVGQEFQEEI